MATVALPMKISLSWLGGGGPNGPPSGRCGISGRPLVPACARGRPLIFTVAPNHRHVVERIEHDPDVRIGQRRRRRCRRHQDDVDVDADDRIEVLGRDRHACSAVKVVSASVLPID